MKNIMVINDISGLGNCSMGAALPVLAKLGHNAMPIVSSAFSCQTGFDGYKFVENGAMEQFIGTALNYRRADAVSVGFCPNAEVLRSADRALAQHADKFDFLLVDPVLGDNGKLYRVFDDNYVAAMKELAAKADLITPNVTEACLLCGLSYEEITSQSHGDCYVALCGKYFGRILEISGAKSAVVTGVEFGNYIGNIVYDGTSTKFVTHDRSPITFSGTGDLFSATLLGELMKGMSLFDATQIAASFVAKASESTQCADSRFGVEFCRVIDLLT